MTTVWHWINQVNAGAGFAGYKDWRLPSEAGRETTSCATAACELETIRDATQGLCGGGSGPCINPIFGPTVSEYYWSATSSPPGSMGAWAVFFGGENVNPIGTNSSELVRAVRGP